MDEQYQDIDVKNIIHTLPNMVFWKDTNSCFRGCNQMFLDFLGLDSYTQLLHKTDHHLPSLKPYAAAEIKIDQSIITTGATIANRDALMHNKAGEVVVISTTKCPLYDHYQNIIGILGVMTDVTEARKMADDLTAAKQYAEAANLAKTEFLATISHDLRTPLNGIIGMSELLAMRLKDPKDTKLIEDIQTSSGQLLDLVEEILNLSSIEAGKLELISKPFNLKALIKSIITNYQVQNHLNPNVTLGYDYPDHLPTDVISDPHRLTQIISNLVGNAYKFTACGEINVKVSMREENAARMKLAFEIEDTGMGIERDKLDTIFGKFAQINSNYLNRTAGVGLGLAIVKRLVLAMDGQINITSEPDVGTKFIVILPFNKQHIKLVKMKPKKQKIDPVTTKIKILVVEDNPINQRFFRMALDALGCQTLMASTGKEAISMFCDSIDIVLMDIGLPDQDGYEVSKKMFSIMKKRKVPIIAVTAHVLEKDKKKCLQAGMQDVATKPISVNTLKDIINKHAKPKADTTHTDAKTKSE